MHRLRCREFAAPRSSFPTRPIPVRNGQLPTDHSEPILSRLGGYRRLVFGVVAALAVPGCGHDAEIEFTKVAHAPTVQLLNPPVRDIIRVVGQPSFIEAYERTSIYAKPTAYIQKWIVDIGDTVKKGDVLATLFVPELVEDHQTKMATVALDQRRIDLAREAVEVAKADVKAAEAQLSESQRILEKYLSEVDRWDRQVKRLQSEVPRGTVDRSVLLESINQLQSSIGARDEAKAAVKKAAAELRLQRATLAKTEVNVKVAEADLKVAQREERRLAAWVGYLTLTAPFDGVITARNANTFDFLLPGTGDPTAHSADPRAPDLSPSGAAAPIYVVDRTDVVRIFVDIPEQDANYVKAGTKAIVVVRAYRDEPIPATVTRTAWALNAQSRTLRAEIDLPNRGSQLLPGMYAYGQVIIERPGVHALPLNALTYSGNQTFCWLYERGQAVRTEIKTGVRDGKWIEVTHRRVPDSQAASPGAVPWTPLVGTERVIVSNLSRLNDGSPVQVAPAPGAAKVAQMSPNPGP